MLALRVMSRSEKVLQRILQGGADANVDFEDLCALLRSLGFTEPPAVVTMCSGGRAWRNC